MIDPPKTKTTETAPLQRLLSHGFPPQHIAEHALNLDEIAKQPVPAALAQRSNTKDSSVRSVIERIWSSLRNGASWRRASRRPVGPRPRRRVVRIRRLSNRAIAIISSATAVVVSKIFDRAATEIADFVVGWAPDAWGWLLRALGLA